MILTMDKRIGFSYMFQRAIEIAYLPKAMPNAYWKKELAGCFMYHKPNLRRVSALNMTD